MYNLFIINDLKRHIIIKQNNRLNSEDMCRQLINYLTFRSIDIKVCMLIYFI